MGTKLIVSGLREEIGEAELYDLFDAYGPLLDVGIGKDPIDGRNLGYGWVVYQHPGHAAMARLSVDGSEIGDMQLWVRPALGKLATDHGVVPIASMEPPFDAWEDPLTF